MVFAIVLVVAVLGIAALFVATRPKAPETVASQGTSTSVTTASTPSTTRAPASTSTTARTPSTTTPPVSDDPATTPTSAPSSSTTAPDPGPAGWFSYSPPGKEYSIKFPVKPQSLTKQFGGSFGTDVTDVEGTLGLENYFAALSTLDAPLSKAQLEQRARMISGLSTGGGTFSEPQSVTVAGQPAVRFKVVTAGLSFDAVIVTSGKTMVLLMGGASDGGPSDFDQFVKTLQFP